MLSYKKSLITFLCLSFLFGSMNTSYGETKNIISKKYLKSKEVATEAKEEKKGENQNVEKTKKIEQSKIEQSEEVIRRYSFYFKGTPLSEVFKTLGMEGLNILYQGNLKVGGGQIQLPVMPVQNSTNATTSLPIPPSPTISPISMQPIQPIPNQPNQSQSQSLDDIVITLMLNDVTLNEAMASVCKVADIYCEKKDKKTYFVRKYDFYEINMTLLFDSYGLDMKTGLGGTGSGISIASGTSSSGNTGTSTSSTGTSSSGISQTSDSFNIKYDKKEFIEKIKSLLSKEGNLIYSDRGIVYVIDRPSGIEKVKKFLEKEKFLQKPIQMSVKLVEVNLSKSNSYGVDWNVFFKDMWNLKKKWNIGVEELRIGSESGGSAIPKGFVLSINAPGKIDLILKLLENQGDIKILRNWNVFAKTGVPVVLSDVESVPYLSEGVVVMDRNVVQTANVNYVDTGIKISILGSRIDKERLDGSINVSLSSLVEIKNLRTVDNPYFVPIVKSSSVIVPMNVKIGDVLLLSGFKTDAIRKTQTGVPGLSRLPLLGYLFRTEETSSTNSELLLLIEIKEEEMKKEGEEK